MADDVENWNGASPWLFLAGLVLFLGSGLLFVADMIRGIDILRSLVANGAGAALLITWAAGDTYSNPEFEVDTAGGAIGTALLLYGLYLLGAGAIIAVTGLIHDRLRLGFVYLGLAVVTVLIGYLIFPHDAITEDEEPVASEGNGGADHAESPDDDELADDQPVGEQ